MVISICDMHKNYADNVFEKSINRITCYVFGNAAGFQVCVLFCFYSFSFCLFGILLLLFLCLFV